MLCFPVTKTSFREAAADTIELTRQSWRGGGRETDEWEQRDRLNRRLDERQLPLLLLKISLLNMFNAHFWSLAVILNQSLIQTSLSFIVGNVK